MPYQGRTPDNKSVSQVCGGSNKEPFCSASSFCCLDNCRMEWLSCREFNNYGGSHVRLTFEMNGSLKFANEFLTQRQPIT